MRPETTEKRTAPDALFSGPGYDSCQENDLFQSETGRKILRPENLQLFTDA